VSHLAFDLDALSLVPKVARAAGVPEGDIAWGLLQGWEWCWRQRTDVLTAVHLRGFFGVDVAEALVAFGFLARLEDGTFRVRGAQRYLRIAEGQSKGGHSAKANLIPGARQKKAAGALEGSRLGEGGAEREPRASREDAESDTRLALGPTASSEQRTAKEETTTPLRAREAEGLAAAHQATSPPQPEPQPAEAASAPYEPLRHRMEAAWEAQHGTPYAWTHHDDLAIKGLMAKSNGDDAVVLGRWCVALTWPEWPSCNSVVDLSRYWNAYGKAPRQRKATGDPRKSPVRAEDMDRRSFANPGVVEDF
jgi:hypothetical protein